MRGYRATRVIIAVTAIITLAGTAGAADIEFDAAPGNIYIIIQM